MPGVRSYAVENFMLTLDGVQCGFVKSVGGGDVSAEVIQEPVGPSYFVKKHIGQPKYEDFTAQIGFGMAQAVYDWIAASWKMNYQRKDGSIVAADYTLKAQSERQFFNALLTETTIPALDASSKDAAYLTITFAPEYTKAVKGKGKLAPPAGKQKLFLPSNFRLELDGIDCTHVSKIDSFTVKQTVVTDDIGDARDYAKEPGKLEFPNLRVTMTETGIATWESWFEDFVIKGNNDDSKEKSGAIVFLAPDLKTELGRVELFNVGIFALRAARQEAHDESIRRVTADLYCERMEFQAAGVGVVVEPKPVLKVKG
ncbi:MAG: phage tail protein [Gaiellaceae bacterium]